MLKQLRPACLMLLVLTAITGLAYPFLVTGLAQLFFPGKANGSLISRQGKIAGSALIGQSFDDARYFSGRPSATTPPYNAAASSGSNLGPSNPVLQQAIQQRVEKLRQSDPANSTPIPVDLVTASGSGLDPHISPAAAFWQVSRVARARGLPEDRVRALVDQHVVGRTLGLFGEPRVCVLELNLDLDAIAPR